MFTVSPVHTRDHSLGWSGADPERAARQIGGGSYIMPIQEVTGAGSQRSPRTPRGSQVDPKV